MRQVTGDDWKCIVSEPPPILERIDIRCADGTVKLNTMLLSSWLSGSWANIAHWRDASEVPDAHP